LENNGPIENEFTRKIFLTISIVYANFIIIPIAIHCFHSIYNYITKGFMLNIYEITTRDDSRISIIIIFALNLIGAILFSILAIYIDFIFFNYIIKL
jgi:hypothetical protein